MLPAQRSKAVSVAVLLLDIREASELRTHLFASTCFDLSAIPAHLRTSYMGVKVELRSFLTTELDGIERSVL